uniref:C2H2-type domain-containing protein n=1 Tax=Parastrongyloides trichosuri TaxID=131310 RepID=A0A0N5A706_PARTI
MSRGGDTFICPHCQETIHVEQISLHAKEIFNYFLHRCPQCPFRTNDSSLANLHRNKSGHKFNDKNGYNKTLEDIVDYTISSFYELVVKHNNIVVNKEKPNLVVKEIESTSNEVSTRDIPSNVKVISTTSIDMDVDLNLGKFSIPNLEWNEETIVEQENEDLLNDVLTKITCMQPKNNVYEFLQEDETNDDITLLNGIKKQVEIDIIPLYDSSKVTSCTLCNKKIQESYLSRRKHVLSSHLKEFKTIIFKKEKLFRSNILIEFFKFIKKCFPDHEVCSDFQCINCGFFYPSYSGMKFHLGCCHQTLATILCPFEDCDFKTRSEKVSSDHVKNHLVKIFKKKKKVTLADLPSSLEKDVYGEYIHSTEIVSSITSTLIKYYFPIGTRFFKSFDDNLIPLLVEFKKNFLKICNFKTTNTNLMEKLEDIEKIDDHNNSSTLELHDSSLGKDKSIYENKKEMESGTKKEMESGAKKEMESETKKEAHCFNRKLPRDYIYDDGEESRSPSPEVIFYSRKRRFYEDSEIEPKKLFI